MEKSVYECKICDCNCIIKIPSDYNPPGDEGTNIPCVLFSSKTAKFNLLYTEGG